MSSQDTPIQGPPRYPPSAVKRWLTCPEFWRLSKRWEPRVELWTPHQSVGTAIHAGIAVYLQGVGGLTPSSLGSLPDPVSEAQRVLEGLYEQQDTWGLDGLQALVAKGVGRLIQLAERDILPGATIVAAEYPDPIQDPRLGTGRLHRVVDCILARGDELEVWDWKSKLRLDEQYLGETARAVLHSWQLLDYSWHTRLWFGKPVSHAAHGLVILGPKLMAHAIPVTITPERLIQWHQQAKMIWKRMWKQESMAHEHYPMNWEACTNRGLHFGKECVFLPACHQLNGNENLFSGVYQLREKDGLLHTN